MKGFYQKFGKKSNCTDLSLRSDRKFKRFVIPSVTIREAAHLSFLAQSDVKKSRKVPIRHLQEVVQEVIMVKEYGLFRIMQSGEWKLTIEILNEGRVVGYVDRIRTKSGKFIKTRNLQGEVMEGECLEWLLRQTA